MDRRTGFEECEVVEVLNNITGAETRVIKDISGYKRISSK
jgi:hypothetical protein